MNKILLLLLSLALSGSAKTQTTYREAIAQGDAAFADGQYKIAINKYFAAQAFDPSQRNIVKEKVNAVFDKIENLRQDAISAELEANKATQQQQSAVDELKRQKDSLISERARADSITGEFQEMKKTLIGAKYQGGIVCYWNDSTGKHGLIAAPNDIDGVFTWQQAKDTCNNLSLNGFDDWRMPDEDEVGYLYSNRNVIGGFEFAVYWSSSEVNQAKGFCLSFNYGVKDNYAFKTSRFRIRPVRAF